MIKIKALCGEICALDTYQAPLAIPVLENEGIWFFGLKEMEMKEGMTVRRKNEKRGGEIRGIQCGETGCVVCRLGSISSPLG